MSIDHQQALACLQSDDLIGIGMEADAVRRRLHPEGVVTYTLAPILTVTSSDLTPQITAALDRGATGLTLQTASLKQLESTIPTLRENFPHLLLSGPTVSQIASLGDPADQVLSRLRTAGLASLSADSATNLRFESALAVHRAAHDAGLRTTATLVFGAGEQPDTLIQQLKSLHSLQQETQGFLAFTLLSAPAPTGRELDDPTAVEYLKTLAVCRIVLDNIDNIEANWQQQGLKVLQMTLRFGANDIGSLFTADAHAPEEEIRRVIRDAGFKPAQRDTLYRMMFLN